MLGAPLKLLRVRAAGACTAPHKNEGDRWPASYLNAKHGGVYSSSDGGLVLNPSLVSLRCGYSQDGSSMVKTCDADEVGCVPGCTGWGTSWCVDTSCLDLRMRKECAWMPNQLQQLLEKQDRCNPYGHNEVVLQPSSVVDHLPHSVRGSRATHTLH